mgnify:CR=1 FL=1
MSLKSYIILSFIASFPFFLSEAQVYTLNEQWVSCGDSVKLLDPYYSDGVSFVWTGGSKDGKAHGVGKAVKYINGQYESTYEGEYQNGIMEGKGKYIHSSGSVREGNFINGQLMGRGILTADDGQFYEGEFVNYLCHGQGKVSWSDGSMFEGFFVSNDYYTGKYTSSRGEIKFFQAGKIVDEIQDSNMSNYTPHIGTLITEYYDANWKRCDEKDASYYRVISYARPNIPSGIVKDYYIDGQLMRELNAAYIDYNDEGKNFYEGEVTIYYKNGIIQEKRYYYNNQLNGLNTFYNEDGSVQCVFNYTHGNIEDVFYPTIISSQMVSDYDTGGIDSISRKLIQLRKSYAADSIFNEDNAIYLLSKIKAEDYFCLPDSVKYSYYYILSEIQQKERLHYLTLAIMLCEKRIGVLSVEYLQLLNSLGSLLNDEEIDTAIICFEKALVVVNSLLYGNGKNIEGISTDYLFDIYRTIIKNLIPLYEEKKYFILIPDLYYLMLDTPYSSFDIFVNDYREYIESFKELNSFENVIGARTSLLDLISQYLGRDCDEYVTELRQLAKDYLENDMVDKSLQIINSVKNLEMELYHAIQSETEAIMSKINTNL